MDRGLVVDRTSLITVRVVVTRGLVGTGRHFERGGLLEGGGLPVTDGVLGATRTAVASLPLVIPRIPGGPGLRVLASFGTGPWPSEPVVSVIGRGGVVVLAPWDRESFVVAAVAGTGRGVARLVSLLPTLAGQLLVARRSCLPR